MDRERIETLEDEIYRLECKQTEYKESLKIANVELIPVKTRYEDAIEDELISKINSELWKLQTLYEGKIERIDIEIIDRENEIDALKGIEHYEPLDK